MILYFLKTVICSGLLLLAYIFLLSNEKTLRFNRIFLLSAIVLSLVIPVITIEIRPLPVQVIPISSINEQVITGIITPVEIRNMGRKSDLIPALIGTIYVGIALLLLLRFAFRVITIAKRTRNNTNIPFKRATLVLMDRPVMPHSFGKYLFVSRREFEQGRIREEIIYHELAHIYQHHSWDILFVEFVRIVAWFNPLFYCYRRALQLNHEYLADEAVIHQFRDTPAYQGLLVATAGRTISRSLASQFNFLTIKKRLIMMTRTSSEKRALLKQAALLPVFAVLLFICCTRSIAQVNPAPKKSAAPEVESTTTGISQDLQDKYNAIVERNKQLMRSGRKMIKQMPEADRDSLETIFKQMTKEQQAKQEVTFLPPAKPLPRTIPSPNQFESFKDPALYGVWINNKKVSNADLDKYANTDFAQVFISILYGAAKKSYVYQVDLMTTDFYNDYYEREINNKRYGMLFRWAINGTENRYRINTK